MYQEFKYISEKSKSSERFENLSLKISKSFTRHPWLGVTNEHNIGPIPSEPSPLPVEFQKYPKYIENKLKFFPFIKEAVAFGNEKDYVSAFLCIDIEAVGNWAERQNLSYSGYTDLSARSEVYDMLQECVETVNSDLARDEKLSGSQIKRFLLLHKELHADDGELTRTRKVRRRIVAEKYDVLIDALYEPATTHCEIESEMTFEDGRTGIVHADLQIREAERHKTQLHTSAA